MNVNIQAFRRWQQQGNRRVQIEMGGPFEKDRFKIWVYDYDLQVGQFVQSVDEIDLLKEARERAEKEYERLQKIINHAV